MLSYQHGYHAGNHADVLKHLVLVAQLDHMLSKDKPLTVIDTHAGAGHYDLGDARARRNREHEGGIGRLWERHDKPAAVRRYVEVVRAANESAALRAYPGSPWIARSLLRPVDTLHLFERHPGEFRALERSLAGDRRVHLHASDGYAGLATLLPPPSRRGLVLVDPSWETQSDDDDAVRALRQGQRRFATGTYLLWYPVVRRARIARLCERLQAAPFRDVQRYELRIGPDGDGRGMTGSGIIAVRPAWTLKAALTEALPWLAGALGDADGGWTVETLVPE